MTVLQINHFIESYFTHNLSFDDTQIKNYNKDITTIWNDIKDFIVLHYHSLEKIQNFGLKKLVKRKKK